MGKRKDPTAGDLIGPYLDRQCSVLLDVAAELQSTLTRRSDPGPLPAATVHDGRVACRRLRSTMTAYGTFLAGGSIRPLIDGAGWYATKLGAVRDLQVVGDRIGAALERLDDDLVLHEARAELTAQIAYRQRIAVAEVRDAIHDEAHADLIDRITGWRQQPSFSSRASKPATKIRKAVNTAEEALSRRLRTAAAALASQDPEAGDLVHAARRAGKRLRYVCEVAQPVLGPDAERRLDGYIALQDLLGDFQDSRVASTLLRDLGGIPGRNGFTFGLLYAQETEHRRRLAKKIVKRARGV